jgi:hypothetical protein
MMYEALANFSPDDSVYSDTARALVMAYNSQDSDLIAEVIETALIPLLEDSDGIEKMIAAFVRGYHSIAFGMAMVVGMDVSQVIRMDATADYMAQSIIMDGQENDS